MIDLFLKESNKLLQLPKNVVITYIISNHYLSVRAN